MILWALIAAAGISADLDVALPVTCSYVAQDLHGNPMPTTVARWRAFKAGAQWKSRAGSSPGHPWVGTSFNCADFGITKTVYDGSDYFLFDTDHGTKAMCIPGKPCPCTVQLICTSRSCKNICP